MAPRSFHEAIIIIDFVVFIKYSFNGAAAGKTFDNAVDNIDLKLMGKKCLIMPDSRL
jgi:hypothetical protein